MLTEQRYEMILNLLEENKSVTVNTRLRNCFIFQSLRHAGTLRHCIRQES